MRVEVRVEAEALGPEPRFLVELEPPAPEALAAARRYARAVEWRSRVFNAERDSFEAVVEAVDVPARVYEDGRMLLSPIALGAVLRAAVDAGYRVRVEAPREVAETFSAWFRGFEPGPDPYPPRPYQAEAVEKALRAHFFLGEYPTGSGKTFIAAKIIKAYAKPTLVLEPTRDLVLQTLRRLKEYGVPAGEYGSGAPVQVATYQRVSRSPVGLPFAVLVLDEAHHAPARTWRRALLFNPWYAVVALTATAERGDGNTDVFDKLATRHRKSYRELMEQGWLAPLEFVIAKFRDEGLVWELSSLEAGSRDWRSFRARAARLWQESAARVAAGVASRAAETGRKVIVFSDFVSVVEDIARSLGGRAAVLHGRLPLEKRRRALDAFREGAVKVLVTSPAGNEGLDIPDADVAVLLDVPNRLRLRQRIGRVTRPAPGKVAHVVFLALDADVRRTLYVRRLGVTVDKVYRRVRAEAGYYGAPVYVRPADSLYTSR